MIPNEIKQYFQRLTPPKGTRISVGDDIVIVSTNTNYYSIGFYTLMIVGFVGMALASGKPIVLLLALPFLPLIFLNLRSRTDYKLTAKTIEVKSSYSPLIRMPISEIKSIKFQGLNIRSKRRVSQTCLQIQLQSGQNYKLAKMAANQKFTYRCVEYFVEQLQQKA